MWNSRSAPITGMSKNLSCYKHGIKDMLSLVALKNDLASKKTQIFIVNYNKNKYSNCIICFIIFMKILQDRKRHIMRVFA